MSSWCQRQAYQYFFLLAFTDVPMILSDIFFFFSFLKMYFISIAIILNKVIIFTNPLTFFGGDFSDLQKLM